MKYSDGLGIIQCDDRGWLIRDRKFEQTRGSRLHCLNISTDTFVAHARIFRPCNDSNAFMSARNKILRDLAKSIKAIHVNIRKIQFRIGTAEGYKGEFSLKQKGNSGIVVID